MAFGSGSNENVEVAGSVLFVVLQEILVRGTGVEVPSKENVRGGSRTWYGAKSTVKEGSARQSVRILRCCCFECAFGGDSCQAERQTVRIRGRERSELGRQTVPLCARSVFLNEPSKKMEVRKGKLKYETGN